MSWVGGADEVGEEGWCAALMGADLENMCWYIEVEISVWMTFSWRVHLQRLRSIPVTQKSARVVPHKNLVGQSHTAICH